MSTVRESSAATLTPYGGEELAEVVTLDVVQRNNARMVRAYLQWLREQKRVQPRTVYQYGAFLTKYLEVIGNQPLEAVSIQSMEAWLQRDRNGGRRPATATLARGVAILKGLYGYLHASRAVEHNPTALLITPRVSNKQPKAIGDDTWLQVWTHEAVRPVERIVLGLGFFCGLRREEICALRPTHIVGGQIVRFIRKGGGEDVFPIDDAVGVFVEHLPHLLPDPDAFMGALAALVKERRGHPYLIPWGDEAKAFECHRVHIRPPELEGMTNPDQVNRRLRRLLPKCGLPEAAFTAHALRHSFCTNLLRAGVPLELVSQMANHQNIQTTMRYVKSGANPLSAWRVQHSGTALTARDNNRFGG